MMRFGASIEVDIELLDVDIRGSRVWVEALGKAGILSGDEVERITAGLKEVHDSISAELAEGTFVFDASLEDIHMTVESRLIELLG